MRNSIFLFLLLSGVTFANGNEECGVPAIKPVLERGDRIAGGQEAVPHSWPWMAALYEGDDGPFCGGVLISHQHVLTAAHCVCPDTGNDISVHLGSHNRTGRGTKEVVYKVKEICVHPQYPCDKSSDEVEAPCLNDIAIITLQEEVKFSNEIWPVCLPSQNEKLQMGSTYFVTGWGTTTLDKTWKVHAALKQAQIMETPCPECHVPTESLICVHPVDGVHRSGDSGGPVVHLQNDIWTLYGLVSCGPDECLCLSDATSAETRVSHFIDDFIQLYTNPKTSRATIRGKCTILRGSAQQN